MMMMMIGAHTSTCTHTHTYMVLEEPTNTLMIVPWRIGVRLLVIEVSVIV